jgi:Ni,Fe-hydrogenase III component G
VDTRDRVEMIYHYCMDRDGVVVSLRTWAWKPELRLDSVAPFLPAADWIEREVADLLGVVFVNHPDPRRLILADDWPEGVYPLRRDFPDRIEETADVTEGEPVRSATK